MMCPTFILFDFVGAFFERPYKSLIDQDLLASLFDSNCNSNGHTDHGVVTCADQAHHFGAAVSFETH